MLFSMWIVLIYYQKYYYRYNLSDEDHYDLAEILRNIKGRFLLSYQDCPLMRKLYKGYNFYKYTGNNFILKPEIAITNY
jgi:DNA adenine methylase